MNRILLAWLAVAGWLLLWEALARPVARGGLGPWVRGPFWPYPGEALLLTLLGTLWFGSLGAGGWWLVFALVGAIAAWPAPGEGPRRRRDAGELAARSMRAVRILGAGGILAWRLATG